MLSPLLLPKRILFHARVLRTSTMCNQWPSVFQAHGIKMTPIGIDQKRWFSRKHNNIRPKLLGNNNQLENQGGNSPPSDVLYEYNRNTYFTMISSASLLQIAFWSWLKGTEATLPAAPLESAANLDPSFLSIVTNEAWSTVGLGTSVIMAMVVMFFSQRSIARISVISGGGKLRLTTHKFLGGLSPPLDYPVAQLRAAATTSKYISVKVADEPGFYLIDLDGQFLNRSKLDQLLKTDTSKTIQATSKEEFRAPIRRDLPKTQLKKKN